MFVSSRKGSYLGRFREAKPYPPVNSKNYGKSLFFIGKSTINGPCSIVMFVYQRVTMTYNYMTYLGGDILIGPVGNSVPAAPAPCFRYLESGSSIGFEIAMGNGPFVDYFHLKFLKW